MLNTISSFNVLYFMYFLHLLLHTLRDIERNHGPQNVQIKNLSCCHLNVNSLAAQSLSKLTQLEAYNSLYKHDFMCISETYFDSSVLEGDSCFQFDRYKVIRADHPSNTKRGGVCIYYKESLSVRALNLTNLNECIICEVSIQNRKGYISIIYRSSSQSTAELEELLSDFEDILNTTVSSSSLFTTILGDFNARSSSCWRNDKTTVEGAHLEVLTSLHGFQQLISEPTHLLPTSTFWIDLIFTDQSNLVVDSGTHSTLNPKCHHQITHCQLNLNIKYPPPYQWLVWNYTRANVESIKRSIELVNWETLFHNKTVHKQVSIFNETLTNIFSNFIPNKYITFDDRDPPWMNDFVTTKIKFKNQLLYKNGYKENDYNMLHEAINEISKTISKRKEEYHYHLASKLNNSAKTY